MNHSTKHMGPLAVATTLALLATACSDPTPSPTHEPPQPQAMEAGAAAGPAIETNATPPPATTAAGGDQAPSSPAGLTRDVRLYSGDFDAVAQGQPQAGWAWATEQWIPTATTGPLVREGLPLTADPSTVVLEPGSGAVVEGQRFVGAHDPEALRAMAVGRRVKVWTAFREAPLEGTLANAQGPSWVLSDGGRTLVIDQAVAWEGPVAAGNRSRWEWDVRQAGEAGQPWRLSYGFSGAAWQADTVLTVQPGEACSVAWATDALVANRSGQDIHAQGLTLVAGSAQHDRNLRAGRAYARATGAEMMVASAPPAPVAQGEQYHYELQGAANLPHGAIARVPLVRPPQAVACQRHYVVGQPQTPGAPPRPFLGAPAGGEQPLPVHWQLVVANTTEAGLGVPLPAGRVRVMDSGAWAGDARIEHTPAGGVLELPLGQPFDLTATRTVAGFEVDADRLGVRETVRVVLKNAKDVDATIQVHETFPRWREWNLIQATLEPALRHAQGARFDVVVPANSEAALDYTVHYRWPDLGPVR